MKTILPVVTMSVLVFFVVFGWRFGGQAAPLMHAAEECPNPMEWFYSPLVRVIFAGFGMCAWVPVMRLSLWIDEWYL